MKRGNNSGAFFSKNRSAAVKAGVMLSAAAVAGIISAGHAMAASGTWQDTAGDNAWSNAANWSAQPGATSGFTNTDTATFSFPNVGNGSVTVDSGRNLQSIKFDNTFPPGAAPAYTLSGATLLMTSAGSITTTNVVAQTETISSNIFLEPASSSTASNYSFGLTSPYAVGAGSLNITGNVSGDTTNTTTSSSNLTFNGVNYGLGTISGSISNGGAAGGLNLIFSSNNNATWVLSGNNTYTGTTTINGETVIYNSAGAFSTGSLTNVSGGSVVFGTSSPLPTTNFNLITGGIGYGGGITNSTFVNYINSLVITPGTASVLIDSAADASAAVSFNNGGNYGNMSLGAVSNFTYTGALTPNSTLGYQLGGGSGTLTVAQVLSDANGPGTPLTVIGSSGGNGVNSNVVLSAGVVVNPANTYSGITTLGTGGILIASNLATEGATGGVASSLGESSNAATNLVFNGGTLRYTGAAATTDRGFTINGSAGTIDASGSGAINFSGGTIAFGAGGAGRTLTLTGTGTGILNTAFSDNNGAIGSLTKSGIGTWTLSGANLFSGTTTLSSGYLNIANANALGTSTLAINGGTLDNTTGSALTINNNETWGGNFNFAGTGSLSTGNGSVTLTGTRTITTLANSFTVPGVISGATFGVTKQGLGTLNLLGANSYTGTTSANGGLLALGTTGSIGSSAVSFSNGELSVSGVGLGAARSVTTTGSLTDNIGYDVLTLNTDSGQNVTFTAGSLANRSSGANGYGSIELYRGPSLGVGTGGSPGSNIFFTIAPTVTNSGGAETPGAFASASGNSTLGVTNAPVLRGALIDNTSATGKGVGFATYDTSVGVRLLNPSTEQVSVTTAAAYTATGSDTNVRIGSSVASPITALTVTGKQTNTLQLDNTNGSTLMTITNSGTALFPVNGLLFTGSAPITLTGGTLAFNNGAATVGDDLSVMSTNTAGVTIATALTGSKVGSGGVNVTFGGPGNFTIANNPATGNSGGVYFAGPGTATLTSTAWGPSSSGTVVDGGTVSLGTGFALSTSVSRPLSVAAGATFNISNIAIASTTTSGFDALNNVNGLGGVVTNGGANLTNFPLSLDNGAGNFAGSITGNINLVIAKQGTTTTNTQVLTGTSSYLGSTLITSNAIVPGQNIAVLQVGFGGSLPSGTTVTMGGGYNSSGSPTTTDSGMLVLGDVNGPVSQTIGGLATASTATGTGATGSAVVGGAIVNSTLTVSSSTSGATTFAGLLGGPLINQNNLAFVKAGTSTLTLTGASTFTGGTTINGGTLKIDNTTGSGTGTGPVAVNSAGTLAGTGIIGSAVTGKLGWNSVSGRQ